jgi:hypothetical protein
MSAIALIATVIYRLAKHIRREVAVGVKVMLVPDSAQPHVITADILRFLNRSLKEANWTLNL